MLLWPLVGTLDFVMFIEFLRYLLRHTRHVLLRRDTYKDAQPKNAFEPAKMYENTICYIAHIHLKRQIKYQKV